MMNQELGTKTDWSLCILCQESKSEALQCPADSKRSDVGAGYKTLAENIQEFNELGCMPIQISLSRLNEGDGMENTFLRCKARWHKSCHLLFNSTKLNRAKKRQAPTPDSSVSCKYTRSSSSSSSQMNNPEKICFFCDQPSTSKSPTHDVCTFGLDARVRRCALALQDQKLLAKLSAGDLVALEACYHSSCLVSLYKRAETVLKDEADDTKFQLGSIVLAELITYIEEARASSDSITVFKLVDLANMYTTRMEQLGADMQSRVHTTRLKEQLLSHIPELEAYKQGRDIFLGFKEDVGLVLNRVLKEDCDDEAIHLAKAASIIRRDMLQLKSAFNGYFESNCQIESVPTALLSLVNMILYGPSIQTQASSYAKFQAGLSIAQLLQYNSFVRRREGDVKQERHNKTRETPLPIYTGLVVHAKTRSRDLVEKLHELGLSISYDRVLAISTELGNSVCHQYHQEDVVCPPSLRKGLFTTAAVDNIDHNPSSTTAHDSFHGTGISLFQQPSVQVPGICRPRVSLDQALATGTKSVVELPESYSQVPPVVLPNKNPLVPEVQSNMRGDGQIVAKAIEEEFKWLEDVKETISGDEEGLPQNKTISWSVYHSNQSGKEETNAESAISSLLPLFPDQAKSAAMICHSLNIIKACVDHLNTGQIPVVAMDQPLYAVAKEIQWNFPGRFGERQFVIMFGGLHIEMVFLKAIGGWLEGSGWTTALAEANVATAGTSDSFLKAASVTRTRRAHQITTSSLYALLTKSYQCYKDGLEQEEPVASFSDWCLKKVATVPQFHFSYLTLQLELLLLVFVRSLREANFELYLDSLSKMVPWLFGLDHTHYARWLPIHLRDMYRLQDFAPDVALHFKQGKFVVNKTSKPFSSIPIDQAHEQNNALVKGEGGAVGLTENPSALRRWMVSGPEMARVINEFEASIVKESTQNKQNGKHHEDTRSLQSLFYRDVTALTRTIEEMGNPFMEETEALLVLDTKEIMSSDAVVRLRKVEEVGMSPS